MIRMFQSQTSAHAKSYFRDALSKADYFINDQELNGRYNGKIAHKLGLEGQFVDRDGFEKLCDNINPTTGGSLTPRTVKDRRVGYDISFHCPKSVSIVHALSDDDTIRETFQSCVDATMREIEADSQTRVRTQGQQDDRDTGSLIWTDFVHQTARPVDGHVPDPHLHCHCFTFNVTYDEVEDKYKAGQFHNIKRDMPYYQARFQKRLADSLANQGYGIRKTRNGFEMSVVPQKAIDHFSKRTNLIGQVAKDKGIVNRKELDELGARTRDKKQSTLSMSQLQEAWRNQLEKEGIGERAKSEAPTQKQDLDAEKAVDYAIDHLFTRSSVKRERQILAQSYLHSIDENDISLLAIDKALSKDERIFKIESGNQTLCTTALVLAEERNMVQVARESIGRYKPFQPSYSPEKKIVKGLGEEQRTALSHILTSQDGLIMIKGGAGTGKTTLIKHAVDKIEESNKSVTLLAPTSDAAHDVLKSEGFERTDTVARFLMDKTLQEKAKGQVIWVDEAGMLGTSDAAKLLQIAKTNQSRLIFSGDPRQHSAVNRGDAMRILKDVGHIRQASLETIYRQRADHYKSAVFEISQGNIATGFEQLETMKAIRETNYDDISQTLTNDYLKIRADKKSALVISPTREQSKVINQDIRSRLKEAGIVKKKQATVTVLDNLYLTDAQKQDSREYRPGDVIQIHQNMTDLKRGSRYSIQDIDNENVIVRNDKGVNKQLPLNTPNRFDVYRKRELTLAKGDEVRITKNGFDKNGKRLNNGTVLTVKSITKKHGIKAVKKSKFKSSSFQLDKDFGNLDYAYCSTSYSSQGKTVDYVLINQPSVTFPASNQKQFYVSVSRGREGVTIYTDDKEDLLYQIQQSGNRQGATELVSQSDLIGKGLDLHQARELSKQDILKTNNREYEPEI